MATAPRPGATSRKGLILTAGGRTFTVDFDDFGPKDAAMVRKATGFALRTILDADQFDLDSIAALWWLLRWRDGERKLRYEQVLDECPTYGEMSENPDLLKIEAVEDTDDDEVEPGPLPSGDS